MIFVLGFGIFSLVMLVMIYKVDKRETKKAAEKFQSQLKESALQLKSIKESIK